MLNVKNLLLRKCLGCKPVQGGQVVWATRVPGSCPAPWVAAAVGRVLVTMDLWSDLVQPLASAYVAVAEIPLCSRKTPWAAPVLLSWLGTGGTDISPSLRAAPASSEPSDQLLLLHWVYFKLSGFGFRLCEASRGGFWQRCQAPGVPASPGPRRLPLLLVLFQAARRGRSRPAKGMKDASTARSTAGRLRKEPRTACAETDITGQTPIPSTCRAPVCGLRATGEGQCTAGKGDTHQSKH